MWPTSCAASWRQARQGPLGEHRRVLVALRVRPEQPLRDQVVLAHAQRAQRHHALDDLARARVGDRAADAPAARRAVDPVDHVVARVERVDVRRAHLDAERVLEPGRLERFRPPARAFQQRRAHRLGRARIEVVHDRLLDGADGRRGIGLLETVALHEPALERLVQAGRPLLVAVRDEAGARIVFSRPVAVVGQLDERVVHAQAGRLGARGHVAHALEEAPAAEVRVAAWPHAARGRARLLLEHVRELDLDLGVLREVERAGPVEAAALLLELVSAGTQPLRQRQVVADQPVGRVHQHAPARLGRDREAPQDRARERVAHGPHLLGVRRVGAKGVLRLDQQHLGPGALEEDDALALQLSTVQADVVRAQPRREPVGVQHLDAEARDLEVEPAAGLVPVEREEAVELLHAGGLRFDRGRRRWRRRRRVGQGRGGQEREDARRAQVHRGPPEGRDSTTEATPPAAASTTDGTDGGRPHPTRPARAWARGSCPRARSRRTAGGSSPAAARGPRRRGR